MSICWRRNINYGSPPWNTGVALRFLSLRRGFLQECWRSKAALRLTSSTRRCCWDVGEGLEISKRLFTGLRLMLLFLNFPEETRKLLGPGTLVEGVLTRTYSTRPSSTTFEILTPDRDVEPSDDNLIPPTANHCSCESFNILRRSRASLTHPQTSATTWERDVVSTWLHGSKRALCVILSDIAANSFNMAIPESERSSAAWNGDSSQSPGRKGSHFAHQSYKSSPDPNWWWTAHHKSLVRAQWELSTGKPEKANQCFPNNDRETLPHWPRYII